MERKFNCNVIVTCLHYSWDQILWPLIYAILVKLEVNLVAVVNLCRNSRHTTRKSYSIFNVMLQNIPQIITTKLRESQHSTLFCYAWKCCTVLLPRKNWFAFFATLNFRIRYRVRKKHNLFSTYFSICVLILLSHTLDLTEINKYFQYLFRSECRRLKYSE